MTRQEQDDLLAQYDPMHAQSTYRNPFTQRSDSRPFYVQANEAMPAYQGPQQLDSQFQSNWGPEWEQNMRKKQALESRGALDKMNATNSSNWATARSGMAMRGGIDQGARERMAGNAAKQGIMGGQEQSRLDQMANLGISGQAQEKAFDAQKFNTTNAINNGLGQNAYNLSKYNTMMQGYAADKSAKATENAGKK